MNSPWIIIQARTGSKRLPNKVLAKIGDKTMLEHVYHRCKEVTDQVILAVPQNDHKIKGFCNKKEIRYFQGSEDDVLDRYYRCACYLGNVDVIRVTADCPSIQRYFLEMLMNFATARNDPRATITDYAAFTKIDGWECEFIKFKALEKAAKTHRKQNYREHVTLCFREHPEKYRIHYINDLISPFFIWNWIPKLSVDTQEDLDRIREIYRRING